MLKYAHENGCPWDEWTCRNAAEGGHLDVLKYAHENWCPWDESTRTRACRSNHLDVLKYAVENGCPYDKEGCKNMAKMPPHNWEPPRDGRILAYIESLPDYGTPT